MVPIVVFDIRALINTKANRLVAGILLFPEKKPKCVWIETSSDGEPMQYYTMKMRKGKDGVDDPELVSGFIRATSCIGVGDPSSTNGYGTFCSMQLGDIVLVRAAGNLGEISVF